MSQLGRVYHGSWWIEPDGGGRASIGHNEDPAPLPIDSIKVAAYAPDETVGTEQQLRDALARWAERMGGQFVRIVDKETLHHERIYLDAEGAWRKPRGRERVRAYPQGP